MAKDPQDENRRVLAGIKNNLAPIPESLAFRIEGVDGASRIVWEGVTAHTADQLLAAPVSQEERSALDVAGDFLRDILEDGPVDSVEVMKMAGGRRISEKTLLRAKTIIGVRSKKTGFGKDGCWFWSLDGQDAPKVVIQDSDHLRENLTTLMEKEDPRTPETSREEITLFPGDNPMIEGIDP